MFSPYSFSNLPESISVRLVRIYTYRWKWFPARQIMAVCLEESGKRFFGLALCFSKKDIFTLITLADNRLSQQAQKTLLEKLHALPEDSDQPIVFCDGMYSMVLYNLMYNQADTVLEWKVPRVYAGSVINPDGKFPYLFVPTRPFEGELSEAFLSFCSEGHDFSISNLGDDIANQYFAYRKLMPETSRVKSVKLGGLEAGFLHVLLCTLFFEKSQQEWERYKQAERRQATEQIRREAERARIEDQRFLNRVTTGNTGPRTPGVQFPMSKQILVHKGIFELGRRPSGGNK